MLVNEWVETAWTVLNVRNKTFIEYKHLYERQLELVIGSIEINSVLLKDLQVKLHNCCTKRASPHI